LPVCFPALIANRARSWSRVQKGCFAQELIPISLLAQLLTLGISQRLPNPSSEALEQRQAETVRRLIDAIVWEWDNPYSDPGSSGWVPLDPGEDEE
jgi:hypothetical protein